MLKLDLTLPTPICINIFFLPFPSKSWRRDIIKHPIIEKGTIIRIKSELRVGDNPLGEILNQIARITFPIPGIPSGQAGIIEVPIGGSSQNQFNGGTEYAVPTDEPMYLTALQQKMQTGITSLALANQNQALLSQLLR